jgi:hypothetical protein
MPDPAQPPPPARRSERMLLARLAQDAALVATGVVETDAGPGGTFTSVGDGERIEGVRVTADDAGRFDVGLRLICEPVPLIALGERLREEIERRATRAGLALGRVDVVIAELVEEVAT